MQIFVKLDSGKNLALEVETNDTIENVDAKITDMTGQQPGTFSITYNGKTLQEGRTLADYNIQKESILQEVSTTSASSGTGSGSGSGSDAGSGSGSSANAAAQAACFSRGTLIEAPQGDVPIETLRAGDWVFFIPYAALRQGRRYPRLAQVKWVARKRVMAEDAGVLASNRPLRIARGALGEDTPRQDLRLTGHHQILTGKTLAPAGLLVDDRAITWQDPEETEDYFHVEFDQYGLVLANGLPCETFLDVGNRLAFDNA